MPLCVVGLLSPAGAQADKHHGCYPRRSLTVAENRKARFFVIRRHSGLWYYGCLFSQGKPRGLRENPMSPSEVEFGPHKLAGGYIAYTVSYSSSIGGWTELRRLDLRRGRTRTLDEGGWALDRVATIERFVLTRFGAMTWSVSDSQLPTEIHKFDRDGEAVVDSGEGIVADSLRLAAGGRRATWQHDGRRRSIRLR